MARGERKFRDEASGALTKKKSSQASLLPTKTKTEEADAKPRTGQAKTSTSEVQTSRGNLHLSESDWGEFLLKFDLGPHVASLVMSTPLFVKLFMCGAGGAQVLG